MTEDRSPDQQSGKKRKSRLSPELAEVLDTLNALEARGIAPTKTH